MQNKTKNEIFMCYTLHNMALKTWYTSFENKILETFTEVFIDKMKECLGFKWSFIQDRRIQKN